MSCDNVITVQDLETDKKHSTFYREVITGKAGGTGADIDYATNAVTGQVQKTLPATIDGLDWSYVGKFADGVTFTKKTDFAIDADGTQWIYTGSLPFTATAGTVPSEPTYQVVHASSHGALSDRSDPNAHPASAISTLSGESVQDVVLRIGNQAPSITPAYIETLSTGLLSTTPDNVVGLEIAVTGGAGSKVLTTAEAAKVAGIGSTTRKFEAALVGADTAFFATVASNNGGTTITLDKPLTDDFSGVLSPKYDAANGQHLSPNGTIAYAYHAAEQSGLYCSRGGVMDGAWLLGKSSLQTAWDRNAALKAYGIVNSAAPIVQTSFTNLSAAQNIIQNNIVTNPVTLGFRGVSTGTHLAGHGLTASFHGNGEDLVIEFFTSAYRLSTELSGVDMAVVVTNNGNEIYSKSSGAALMLHRVPVSSSGAINVKVTNTDGQIYEIYVTQNTVRKAGVGGKLFTGVKKVVCLGDSWFEYYGGLFASTLQSITGCKTVNHALGGQTTEWALAWFDEYVRKEAPDICVFHFFTNDVNNLSSQIFVAPDGSTLSKWPLGLTDMQSQEHWRKNIEKLADMCLEIGVKPIFINAGGTAAESQTQKHCNWSWNLDRSLPDDFITTNSQLTDSTSFINNFGKREGAIANLGNAIKYALGSQPADAWKNPVDDALQALQRLTLSLTDYSAAASFNLGVDDNADGISDGLVSVSYGTTGTGGETLTRSVSGGKQVYGYSFVAGNDGNRRLRFDFSMTAGKDYLIVLEYDTATAFPLDAIENISTAGYVTVTTSSNAQAATTGASGEIWLRVTALATATEKGFAIAPQRSNGTTRSVSINKAYCVDIAALAVDAPNTASMSNAEIVAFVKGMKP